jgi:hypothetical protein
MVVSLLLLVAIPSDASVDDLVFRDDHQNIFHNVRNHTEYFVCLCSNIFGFTLFHIWRRHYAGTTLRIEQKYGR